MRLQEAANAAYSLQLMAGGLPPLELRVRMRAPAAGADSGSTERITAATARKLLTKMLTQSTSKGTPKSTKKHHVTAPADSTTTTISGKKRKRAKQRQKKMAKSN